MDVLCGQNRKKDCLNPSGQFLLRRRSSEPGMTGLSEKGQEMEDLGRMMKD